MHRLLRVLLAVLLLTAACAAPAAAPLATAAVPSAPPAAPPSVPAARPSASPAAQAFPLTVSDFQGRAVTLAAEPKRIVSIGPSNTEFLFALGAGARVVATDDFSDEPAAAKGIEHVGGVKVNLERVVALKPDLVVIVKLSDGTIEKLASAGLAVLVVDPQGVTDVAKTATLLGTATGTAGAPLAAAIDARLAAVKSRLAGITSRPRVYHEVDASDLAKIYTVGPGSYLNDIIALAGGTNIAARAATAYPQLSAEEILKSDPEVIVVPSSDYAAKPAAIAARPGWSALSAVKGGRIYTVDPNLVERPGPRLGDAAEAYARLLHPEAFR